MRVNVTPQDVLENLHLRGLGGLPTLEVPGRDGCGDGTTGGETAQFQRDVTSECLNRGHTRSRWTTWWRRHSWRRSGCDPWRH